MKRVGIVGSTGYTGLVLTSLLCDHPNIEISRLYAKQYVGQTVASVYPQLFPLAHMVYSEFDPANVSDVDILFLALPHAQSHTFMATLLENKDLVVIDLSADFRLDDASVFRSFYDVEHASSTLLGQLPLGIPELGLSDLSGQSSVAVPGCFSTSVMLGAYPLIKAHPVESIIVDAKTGVSGAGRSLKVGSLFCEADANVTAYGVDGHRHVPEMEMVLGTSVTFSPHLLPMTRGILSTIYVDNPNGLDAATVFGLYEDFYKDHPFVSVLDLDTPSTRYVSGSNMCVVTPKVKASGDIVIYAAIDNLMKGAAGQALQCMNLMLGFDETAGLPLVARYL